MDIGIVLEKLGDAAVLFQGLVPGPGLCIIIGALEQLSYVLGWGNSKTETGVSKFRQFYYTTGHVEFLGF
jgi:hypothetical protein